MILKEHHEQSFKRPFVRPGRKMSPKPLTPKREDLPLDLTTNQRVPTIPRGPSKDSKTDDGTFREVVSRRFEQSPKSLFLAPNPICTRSFVALPSHGTRSKTGTNRAPRVPSSISSAPSVSNVFSMRSTNRLFSNINNNSFRLPISGTTKPAKTAVSATGTFLKPSTSRTNRPITWRKMVHSPSTTNVRKIKWVPAKKWGSVSEKCNKEQWVLVKKFPTEKQPVFHSVELPRNRSPEESPSLKFPWINPLNRIFLQETPTTDAPGEAEANSAVNAAKDEVTESGKFSDGSNTHTDSKIPVPCGTFAPRSPMTFPCSGTEEPSNNPFKITPQSSWAPQTPDGSSESGSKSILAPSKLNPSNIVSQNKAGSGFGGIKQPPPTSPSSILKPSALGASRLGGIGAPSSPGGATKRFTLPTVTVSASSPPESKPAFKLKPSVLKGAAAVSSSNSNSNNPFTVVSNNKESTSPKRSSTELEPESKKLCTRDGSDSDEGAENSLEDGRYNSERNETPAETKDNPTNSCTPESKRSDVNGSPLRLEGAAAPSFVPLNLEGSKDDWESSKVNGVSASSGSFSNNLGGGFIFGQNLQSRVSGVTSNISLPPTNGEMLSSEGNLFAEAATSLSPVANSSEGVKSLSESSRELSEKEQSLKRKYEEVEVVTGEENEKNVIQMNCKLYGWVNGSWQERGRGILRLNDREVRDELHSRLVIRTQGTLTVMLNAKVFAEMSIEKSNDKSVRFTATGTDGQPKIYLVMGSPKDITLLHNSLEYRVAAARSQSLDEKERAKIEASS